MKNKQLTAHTQSSMDHLYNENGTMNDIQSPLPMIVEFERRESLSHTFTHIFTVVNWRLCLGDVRRQTQKRNLLK